jgi:hypothetical protein
MSEDRPVAPRRGGPYAGGGRDGPISVLMVDVDGVIIRDPLGRQIGRAHV